MKRIWKRLIPTILCLAIVLVAVGCQKLSGGASSEPAASAAASASSASDVSATHTVSTVMGEIEVPANPQRVVVNWYIGDVLAAGLNVVGYFCWAQETMPFYDQMTATTAIQNWEPEEVMALEPDLIITYAAEDFETFSKVAPVLVIEESVPPPERARMIGEAAGNGETANRNIEAFETKLATAKETFQGTAFKGKTFSINEDWGSGSYGIYYETGSRGGTLVYDYLGLSMPDSLKELIERTGETRGSLSYEVAANYFGDYIIWFLHEDSESEYAQTEIWKSIPAVEAGRVLEIPGEYQGLFYYSDILSLTAQMDYLVDALNTLGKA